MKNYIIYFLAMISLGVAGCNKDFLDRNPLDRLSSEQFWETKSDFDMALTAIYGHLQTPMFSAGTPDWDNLTDNAYGQHNSFESQSIVRGDIFPSTGGYIEQVYTSCYAGIARVNLFLFQLANFTGSGIDEQQRSYYEGEARFVRGYYYYMLYACYGDVPLVLEPLNLENQFQAKVTAGEIAGQSLSDLDTAIELLPDVLYSGNNGHLVKSAAQALKLRVLLYAAYGDTGVPESGRLSEARAIAVDLMNAGYSLSQSFESIFRDGNQDGNPEIIFSIKFLAPDNATSMDQWYGDWLVVSPLKNFYDAFEAGDLRRDNSIFTQEVDFGGIVHRPSNNVPTGYGVKKFLSPGLIPYGYSTQSQQDWVMLRYAEVLLSFAEIENELSGPSQAAYDAVNSVRTRAGLSALSGLSQSDFREHIRNERRLEMAFEGQRYFDLKRWRIAGQVLNNVNDGILNYRFEDRFYKWPLPQTEIDRSQGQLIQNPDY